LQSPGQFQNGRFYKPAPRWSPSLFCVEGNQFIEDDVRVMSVQDLVART